MLKFAALAATVSAASMMEKFEENQALFTVTLEEKDARALRDKDRAYYWK